MKLLFVRHAEAEHNTRPLVVAGRALDSKLTEVGHIQAEHLGRDLAATKIDKIVYSPAVRCLETAHAIKKFQKSAEMTEEDLLLEMSQGVAVGMNKIAVTLSPVNIASLLRDKMDFAFVDGETFKKVAQRLQAAVDKHSEEGKTIVFVTHGLAIRCWLAQQKGWNMTKLLTTKISNTQVIEWV